MPKGKIQDSNRKQVAVTRKFKIGGRKSTKSALHMSTEDLQRITEGSGRKKDKLRAQNELARRPSRIIKELIETAEGMVAAGTSEPELVEELKALA